MLRERLACACASVRRERRSFIHDHIYFNGDYMMRKNVQLFALVAVAIAGVLTLTACGGGGGSEPSYDE